MVSLLCLLVPFQLAAAGGAAGPYAAWVKGREEKGVPFPKGWCGYATDFHTLTLNFAFF